MHRRDFLKLSGAAAAAATISFSLFKSPQKNTNKRVGLIGCGWFGKTDLFALMQVASVNVVSLCDVDSQRLSNTADSVAAHQESRKRPKTYSDYRKMLAEKDLDIVLVATPDHWHALVAIAAMESGAHVYLEKPICLDFEEGEALLASARRLDRIVQVGTHIRSDPQIRQIKEKIIDSGVLGRVERIETFRNFPYPPKFAIGAVPATLDFEMWTGPAPLLPYRNALHPFMWRHFSAYSNGALSDTGIHALDTARYFFDLEFPTKVISKTKEASQFQVTAADNPLHQYSELHFGKTVFIWNHQTNSTNAQALETVYHGEKGDLTVGWNRLFFKSKSGETITIPSPPPLALRFALDPKIFPLGISPSVHHHMLNFLQSIDRNQRPASDIAQGKISTDCCIASSLALNLGRPLEFDAKSKKFLGVDPGNKFLRRPYRAPMVHPKPFPGLHSVDGGMKS
ncbi:MAG: Gfo/Idh/MocA family protein [Bdellovibrionota bacterium]